MLIYLKFIKPVNICKKGEKNMKKISVVIPVYNEENVLQISYNKIKGILENIEQYNYEMIFVNDGSKDRTLEMLEYISRKNENIKVISFSRNFGHQAAVTAGIKYSTGDAVVIIDADLQDPPELIPEMIKFCKQVLFQ